MNSLYYKKLNSLKRIFNDFEDYFGYKKSELQKELDNIKPKISREEYERLILAYKSYKDYLIKIFAYSKKIRVIFDKEYIFKIEDLLNIEDL